MKRLLKKILGINNILRIRQIYRFITGNYLTSKPLTTEREYTELHNNYTQKIKNDDFINKNFSSKDINFINDLALITQVTKKDSKINWMHGFVLMKTLRDYIDKNNFNINIFETGTSRGFSSIAMSYVMCQSHNDYKIYTVDILPHERKIYWNCILDLQKGKISRKELLSNYSNYLKKIQFINGISKYILKELNIDRIHFAFLDGSHKYDDVKLEFEYVNKRNLPGDIIVLDDYTPGKFDEIVKLTDEIKIKKNYDLNILDQNKDRGYVILRKK